ncbi:MAG: DUF2934 domain-containing protein [Vicinamibacterales bacterium]
MDKENRIDPDDIARRAYRRFEARGRTDGNDQSDWFEAEREARDEAEQQGRPSAAESTGTAPTAATGSEGTPRTRSASARGGPLPASR